MEVHAGEIATRQVRELGDGADARVVVAVAAPPHGDRGAPVAVAGERPVDVVLEPVAEAAVLDRLGMPADGLVLAQQVGLVRGGTREPRGFRPVDEGCTAAPAVRVRVRVVDRGDEQAATGEVVDELRVGVLDELPRVGRADDGLEARRVVHRVDDGQAFALADLAVDLAERGCEVHDARAVLDGDELVGHDGEGALAVDLEHRERRFVARAHERRRGNVGQDLRVGAEHVGDAGAGHDEVAPALGGAHAHVVDAGTDRGADVRRQGPRRGRPHEQVVVAVAEREPDVDRRFGEVAVRAGLAELVARQRGAAPPAVGHDLVALVDRAGVPDRAEQPPDALDVLVGEGPVRAGGVEPHADPRGERLPVLDVALDRRPAFGVEALDPVVLDLEFGREAQFLFDLDLHG